MTKAMIKRCTGTLVALCIYSISGLNAQNITVKNDCFRTDFSEDGVSVFQVDRDSVNPDNQTQSDVGRYFDTISCQPRRLEYA